jgi:pimeloyl-ACP methyl ester carboxylesterase
MPSLLFPRSLISFVLWSSPLSRRSTSRANEQHHALTVAEVIVSTRQMLAETGLTEGTQSMFVAHSLGTGLVSSIAREAPDLIVGSVLIDPISILFVSIIPCPPNYILPCKRT